MRRAHDANLIEGAAINLGSDSCAEHEWGIKKTLENFGITAPTSLLYGIACRTARTVPTVFLLEGTDKTALVYDGYLSFQVERHQAKVGWKDLSNELKGDGPKLITAWDEDSFGIVAFKDQERAFLRELHQAILNMDVAIWLGGGGVFKNAGLCLGIVSKLPEEGKKVMAESDLDRMNLHETAAKTGVEERLRKAGLRWFALSPRWTFSKEKERTEHPVVFWLNPIEQDVYNYGWFTVEELDMWVQGIGPIPKKGRLETLVIEGKTVDAKRKELRR